MNLLLKKWIQFIIQCILEGEEVKVVWPILGAVLDIFDERIEGLKAQIFDTKTEESDETDVTKKNWIPCANCTAYYFK